ncbi:MAG: VCBS repeat-containing protein [Pseudomonadota bacterium]
MYRGFKCLASALTLALLSACGGGAGGGSGDSPGAGGSGTGGGASDGPSANVKDVLDKLNVATTSTPRVDANGEALPDSYAPFGTAVSSNRFAEMVLLGVPVDDPAISTSNSELVFTNLIPGAGNRFRWERLHEKPVAATPWTDSAAKRASAIADFDNDGLDELAVVYQLDGDVELVIIDDADAAYATSAPVRIANTTVNEIFVAAADFDGDVDADLVVGTVSTL